MSSVFAAQRVQHSHCSSSFIECCQLTLSRFPRVNLGTTKRPYEFWTRVHSGASNSRICSRHGDNLLHILSPSGCFVMCDSIPLVHRQDTNYCCGDGSTDRERRGPQHVPFRRTSRRMCHACSPRAVRHARRWRTFNLCS